jgi:hypothetical protein
MFTTEISYKIKEVEPELAAQEEEYVKAVRSHKDHKTLRAHRENVSNLKNRLEALYNSQNDLISS